jgi:hypothetical protein
VQLWHNITTNRLCFVQAAQSLDWKWPPWLQVSWQLRRTFLRNNNIKSSSDDQDLTPATVLELQQLWLSEMTRVEKHDSRLDDNAVQVFARYEVHSSRFLARKASIKFVKYCNFVCRHSHSHSHSRMMVVVTDRTTATSIQCHHTKENCSGICRDRSRSISQFGSARELHLRVVLDTRISESMPILWVCQSASQPTNQSINQSTVF